MSVVQVVASFSAVAVVVMGLCGLNHMTRGTSHVVRAVFLAMVVSAAAVVLAPLYGDPPPSWADALALASMAAFLYVNKRRTYLTPPRPPSRVRA